MSRLLFLSVLLLFWFQPTMGAGPESPDFEPVILDFPIFRGERLEFFRRADFSNFDPACRPCLVPQNVNCPLICYQQLPSLTLVCAGEIRAISLGPLNRGFRGKILSELFKTDAIVWMTSEGEDATPVRTVRSEAGEEPDQYALDLEGIDGFKNALIRSTPPEFSELNLKIGPQPYTIPLDARVRSAVHDFLRQCPH